MFWSKSEKLSCFEQRWFRKRLQRKRFIEQYHKILSTRREAHACWLQQDRAASVIQKAVRRFLLCRRQEKITSCATRIQVNQSLVLAQDYNLSCVAAAVGI